MKRKYPNTSNITSYFYQWAGLNNALEKILNQSFFHRKLSIEDKITYIKTLSKANDRYWQAVNETYPELKKKGLIIVGDQNEIEVKNPELLINPPTGDDN